MWQVAAAAAAMLAAALLAFAVAPRENLGPITFGHSWLLTFAVVVVPLMLLLGLVCRTLKLRAGWIVGVHFAWLTALAAVGTYLSLWKGSWDILALAIPAGLLAGGCQALVAGLPLRR